MRRALLAFVGVVCCAASMFAAPPKSLDQNWTDKDRQWFYTTAQGSKLVPYAWGLALERADSEELFFADSLARLGYLPNAKSKTNPDGLPVGFVKDTTASATHLGLTCAACHTNQIEYQGTTYQIDGAPADSDLFGLLAELGESLNATVGDGASNPKFVRFAKRAGSKSASARKKLYAQLTAFNRYYQDFITDTTPDTQWGRARIDAFGAIFNRVTSIDLKIPGNSYKPNAPVSVPFLWDTSWHDVVQWNGSAANKFAVLRLARNVGEVLGVFADIKIKKPQGLRVYYESTAKRINLLEIEDRLANLRSPRWPAEFPAIDQTKVDAGKTIYNNLCLGCHLIATPGVFQKVNMTSVASLGTDPAMAKDAATRTVKTGVLEGVKSAILFGPPFGAEERAGSVTFNAVIGAILSPIPDEWFKSSPAGAKTAKASTSTRRGEGSEEDLRADLLSKAAAPVQKDLGDALQQTPPPSNELEYKGRPLDGIWATAPYLHNGSVPTLDDLLKPVDQRPKTFYVGSRAFDPVKVGFSTAAGPGTFLFDTSKPANSNAGHVYKDAKGNDLSAEDRAALIEYLKTL